jgi:hypothetical protein
MLLISDANILIDMAVGDLLEAMFGLEESFAVPDVLYAEELSQHHPELPEIGLLRLTLREEGVAQAAQLKAHCRGRDAPSQNDLFALMLAKQESCPLLTGDKRLRKLATEHEAEIEIRGTLWVTGRLVESDLVTADMAARAYSRMRQSGSRLPWAEVEKQLAAWGVQLRHP